MNLGTIKDKTGTTMLRKRIIKKTVQGAAVGCVAVMAVLGAVALTNNANTGNKPVLDNVQNTQAAVSNGNAAVTTKKPNTTASALPSPAPTPTATTEAQGTGAQTSVKQTMLLPVTDCSVLKGYASDSLLYSNTLKHWSTHAALDLAAPEGTQVLSAMDGTVASVIEDELMGTTVTVAHDNGLETVYASLASVTADITEGTSVLKGQSLGTVGSTASSEASDGAHLHFQVMKDGKSVNPQEYLSDFLK